MRALPKLFDGLNDVDVYTALRRFQERVAAPGEALMTEGQPSPGLVCVAEGSLEIRAGDTVLGVASAGDLVGEMGLFEAGTATASVVAREPSKLFCLDRAGYEGLRDTMHPLAVAIEKHTLRLQVGRMRAMGDRIVALGRGKAAEPVRPGEWFFGAIGSLFGRGGMFSAERVDAMATLRRAGMFEGASDEILANIAQRLKPAAFGPGQLLCTEGERGDRMYFLEDGLVDVVDATPDNRVEHLVTLEPPAAFGMVALAQDGARMSSCVARTRVVVLVLDRAGWDELIDDPYLTGTVFRRAIIRTLSEQLAWSNAILADYEAASLANPAQLQRAVVGLVANPAGLAQG